MGRGPQLGHVHKILEQTVNIQYTHSAHIEKITVKSQMSHINEKIQQKSKNVYNNRHVLIHQITVDVYNK